MSPFLLFCSDDAEAFWTVGMEREELGLCRSKLLPRAMSTTRLTCCPGARVLAAPFNCFLSSHFKGHSEKAC